MKVPTMPPEKKAERMADLNAHIGHGAGDVGRADDRAAVGGCHGILKSTSTRDAIDSEVHVLQQHGNRRAKQDRFDNQRNAVSAAEPQGRVLHDDAGHHRAGKK